MKAMRTVTVEQEVELPGAPEEVYEAYMDVVKHAEFTREYGRWRGKSR